MSKILVVGGAGFIGSNLCVRLVKEGHQVQCLDNYSTGTKDNHVNSVEYITGSTMDIFHLIDDIPDVIYHLGEYSRVEQSFKDIDKVLTSNKIGTLNVLEFSRKYNIRLIYAGSSTKFGNNGSDSSPYAWSKSSNVELIKNYGKWFNLDYCITYFYNVYGNNEIRVGEYATLIGIYKHNFENNIPNSVVQPGTQLRNFTHIEDTIDGLILVGEKGSGDGYGIGSPDSYTVLEIAELFKAPGTEIKMLPHRSGNRTHADVVTARTTELGWTPKHSVLDYINAITK